MQIQRILVVEDSPTDQFMLREMLTRRGYQVATADSGERLHAASKLEEQRRDLRVVAVEL
jgi:twitching motility two-component system response regulator PilH